jgi:predicted dehydrogenase
MSSAGPLGFALVGPGAIAGLHARALGDVPDARLVGVQSRDLGRALAFAREHEVPFATARLDELLARPEVQVVIVTTPSGAHLEPALAAVRAGKHVVVEKPVEITTARVDELLAAADEAQVRVAPIFQARFGLAARQVKAALEAGRLGRLVLASAAVKWHRAPAYYTGWKGTLALDGGAALINQGIHAVDLLGWFAGEVARVAAFSTRRVHTGIEGEDTVCAAVEFGSGALGSIEVSTAVFPGWQRRIELCGEHGSVTLEDDRIARWDFRAEQPEDRAIRAGIGAAGGGSGASNPLAIGHAAHAAQYRAIVGALRADAPLPIDGREARRAVALVEAVYASVTSGRPVECR